MRWTASSVRESARNLKSEGVERLMIAGFSQGGCAALYCGYKFLGAFDDMDELFCAVVCMSSFLCETALSKIPKDIPENVPLLFTSNQSDNVVQEHLSERTLAILKESNSFMITERLHCGNGGHWLNRDCVREFDTFLKSIFSAHEST